MKSTISSIILFLLLVVGCSQEQAYDEALLQAEAALFQHPDSIFRLLQPHWRPQDSTLANANQALFGLLYTEAMHRSGYISDLEEKIIASQQFFERTGDRDRLARATLHHGIILYKKQQVQEAILTMKRAEEMALANENPAFDWYLCSVMADVNDNIGNDELTLRYHQSALKAARQCGVQEWEARSANNIAQVFSKLGQIDSVRAYSALAEKIIDGAEIETRALLLVNQAIGLLEEGQNDSAKLLLQEASILYPTDQGSKLLADIHLHEGDTARAVREWVQLIGSLSADVSIESHHRLIGYLMQQGDIRKALAYSTNLNDIYRKMRENSQRDAVINLQLQYDEQRKERRQYQITIGLFAAIIVLTLLSGIIFWHHRRRIDRMNAQFVENQKKYAMTRDELTQLRLQKEREERENSLQLKEVVSQLHTSADHARPADADTMNAIAQLTIALCPELQALLSQLNLREQNICLLTRHNFLPTEIAVLLDTTPQSITNARTRLLKRLFNVEGGAKDFDLRIREL